MNWLVWTLSNISPENRILIAQLSLNIGVNTILKQHYILVKLNLYFILFRNKSTMSAKCSCLSPAIFFTFAEKNMCGKCYNRTFSTTGPTIGFAFDSLLGSYNISGVSTADTGMMHKLISKTLEDVRVRDKPSKRQLKRMLYSN